MSAPAVSQLHADGRLRHLLTLDGMPRPRCALLDAAEAYGARCRRRPALRTRLAGRTVCTLFFEPSTRTRSSSSSPRTRLGARHARLRRQPSSDQQGRDRARHHAQPRSDGRATASSCATRRRRGRRARRRRAPGDAFVNAGDGRSAHPTQGLLDMLTLRQAKGARFLEAEGAIVGDIRHSRVARSDLHALRTLGAGEIRVCAPAALLPDAADAARLHGVAATSTPRSTAWTR